MTYRQWKLSVSHAKFGLYLLYFILFENFQLWILLILQKAILLSNKYNSYFVIFIRKYKKVCKSVCKSQNVCPMSCNKIQLVGHFYLSLMFNWKPEPSWELDTSLCVPHSLVLDWIPRSSVVKGLADMCWCLLFAPIPVPVTVSCTIAILVIQSMFLATVDFSMEMNIWNQCKTGHD